MFNRTVTGQELMGTEIYLRGSVLLGPGRQKSWPPGCLEGHIEDDLKGSEWVDS